MLKRVGKKKEILYIIQRDNYESIGLILELLTVSQEGIGISKNPDVNIY